VTIASLALVGWAAGIPYLRGEVLGPSVLLPNTAVGFLLGGIALWLLHAETDARPRVARLVATGCLWGMLAIAGAVLIERATGVDLGVDRVLFADGVSDLARRTSQPAPGRIAVNSCICFVLTGIALLTLDHEVGRGRRPGQWLAFVALAIAATALVGYLYGARPLYAFDRVAGMALYTALTFVLLLVGMLAARADRGGIALITGPDLGGVLARRLLPMVVMVPTGLGWLWIRAREGMLVTREGGVAAFVVATIGTLGLVVLLSAQALRTADRERAAALAREAAARRAAEAASRAKSDFLAVMSHELRTPLNAIIGYEALLSDGITGPVTAPQRQQLGRIRAGATHLVGLIDEILTLSRIEAGRERMHIEPVDVARALDDAAAMTAPQAAAKGLTFTVTPPSTPLTVSTDAAKLRQILLNVLSNAVKFTEQGRVELTVDVDDALLTFRVRDTGMGIDAAHLDRIFDPFWQVEQPTTRRIPGTGLGLDVSRRLARLLGGDLLVESVLGEGSVFALTLPRTAG
jgi:signal transduction histidine kinase